MSLPNLLDPGILRSSLLPSLQAHLALAVPAYALGRILNRYESKDVLWSTAPVLVAWYTAVGRNILSAPSALSLGKRIDAALSLLTRADKLLLTGITLWGSRLAYRIISRSIRRGTDDARYDVEHAKGADGWNSASYRLFLPEVLAQALITLPFTLIHNVSSLPVVVIPQEWRGTVEGVAIGLWCAAFGMEVLADWQLARHQAQGRQGLCRTGVWEIVRHPNYLSDFLLTLSYPLLLIPHNLFNPYHLLSPLTNYLFLRFIGGDAQTEAHQEKAYLERDPNKMLDLIEMREEENSFWPGLGRWVGSKWGWAVLGLGGVGWGVERWLIRF